jgi:osmoprotectant transport system substrate-binding protein
MLSGGVDLYVEYTGTALTAVLGEKPEGDSNAVYQRVRDGYARRFALEVAEPLGFENTFAMVVRGEDARGHHLTRISDIAPLAPQWRAGVGYEFLERPDGYQGWTERYGLKFGKQPNVLDLGLIYRALVEKKVDIVAGNSTDGLINALGLVALQDDRHYFPPYDAVPIVRRAALERFPQLRSALSDLAGKISVDDMRRLNKEVDADQRDVAAVVREFRASKGL